MVKYDKIFAIAALRTLHFPKIKGMLPNLHRPICRVIPRVRCWADSGELHLLASQGPSRGGKYDGHNTSKRARGPPPECEKLADGVLGILRSFVKVSLDVWAQKILGELAQLALLDCLPALLRTIKQGGFGKRLGAGTYELDERCS